MTKPRPYADGNGHIPVFSFVASLKLARWARIGSNLFRRYRPLDSLTIGQAPRDAGCIWQPERLGNPASDDRGDRHGGIRAEAEGCFRSCI